MNMPVCSARQPSSASSAGSPVLAAMSCLAASFLAAICGCGHEAAAQLKPANSPAAPASAGGPLEVVVAGPPARKSLKLVTTQPARLEAIEQTPLHSKLPGYVEEVLADYGDKVSAGQPLLRLNLPELEAELLQKEALVDQAAAEVQQAESAVKAAEAAVTTAQAGLARAEAGIARAEADVARWRSELTRYEQLVAGGAVDRQLADETQQKLRAAESARREADASLASAQAAVLQARAEVDRSQADTVAAAARRRVAEADVKQTETMLAYREISAPFAGVVTRRGVDPGHFVHPPTGSNLPLMTIARTDVIRVFIAVPEAEAGYVDIGDEVAIDVPALQTAEYMGKVTRTSVALDPTNRSLETIVDLENPEGRLRIGTFATARLTLGEHKDALTLPAAAVVRQGKQAFCFRLIEGQAKRTAIQLGVRVGDDFEIASGLEPSDLVILNKAAALADGQRVEVLQPAD